MTEQYPDPSNDPDPTIDAIRKIIQTMGAADEQPAGPEFTGWAQQAAGGAEEYLLEIGAVRNASVHQRAVLACLGCQLLRGTGGGEGAYAQRIERCTGEGVGTVSRILKDLATAKVLASHPETTRTEAGSPRVFYTPARNSAGRGLAERLRPPEPCAMEQPPHKLNSAAEEYLLRMGVATNRDQGRRELLGCIACQLHTSGKVEAERVADCRGAKSATGPGRLLRMLEDEGLMRSEVSPAQGRGRPPRQYTPQNNPLAAGFIQRLEVPESCGLEQPRNENPESRIE